MPTCWPAGLDAQHSVIAQESLPALILCPKKGTQGPRAGRHAGTALVWPGKRIEKPQVKKLG